MVRTRNLLQIHMPKTGGSWVAGVLERHLRGESLRRQHDPAHSLTDPERGSRRLIGTVRDPWSWYWSWYRHAWTSGEAHREALAVYGQGDTDFGAVLYGVTHPWKLDAVPAWPGIIWSPTPDGLRLGLLVNRLGLYSWLFWYFYGQPSAAGRWSRSLRLVQHFLDHRNLELGLSMLLGTDPAGWSDVPRNGWTDRRQLVSYSGGILDGPPPYDAGMRRWVYNADRDLIGHFGYRPERPATANVLGLEA